MNESDVISRSVSFASTLTTTITFVDKPPNIFTNVYPIQIIDRYKTCSFRYNCKPLQTVIQQLSVLEVAEGRYALLDLSNLRLSLNQIEAMEEVFRHARFIRLTLENSTLEEEAAISLFEIISFYDSAVRLSLRGVRGLGVRAWVSFMKMLRGCSCISHVDMSWVNLDSGGLIYLSRAFRYGAHVSVLNLENTGTHGGKLSEIVNGLRNNLSIRELYLGGNGIGQDDVTYLKYLLGGQLRLRLLDMSNNELKDNGLMFMLGGINCPLAHLHLSGNSITAKSMHALAEFVADSRLKCLTLSNNPIGDEGLANLKPGLFRCMRLQRLELRNCTQITEGVIALAEFLAESKSISQIDLRGNPLKTAAYFALICSLRLNRSLNQLLLDSVNNADNTEEQEAVLMIDNLLNRNRTDGRAHSEETNSVLSYETSSLLEYAGALAAVTSTGNFIVAASSKVLRSIKGLLFGSPNKVPAKRQPEAPKQDVENVSLEFGSVEMQVEDTFDPQMVEVDCNGHSDDDIYECENI